jgi:hypothetical protein
MRAAFHAAGVYPCFEVVHYEAGGGGREMRGRRRGKGKWGKERRE